MTSSPKSPIHRYAGLPILALLATVAACGEDAVDFATDLPIGTPLELEATPRLMVGAVDSSNPMELLDGVSRPFLMDNGDLVVPNRGDNTIRRYDASGDFVASMGATGEGPGEFEGLVNAWARGDAIEAFDRRNRRVTRFTSDGDVSTVPLRGFEQSPDLVLGPLGDGWAVLVVIGVGYGDGRDELVVHRVDDQGEARSVVAPQPGFARYESTEARFTGPHPLSPTALYAAHGDEVYAAETLTPELDIHTADGTSSRTLALPLPAPLTPDEAMARVAERGQALGEEVSPFFEAYLTFPDVDQTPLFGGLLVDELGFIWIQLYDPTIHSFAFGGSAPHRPGPGGEWMILSPEGAEVSRITLPADLTVSTVRADALVGVREDDLGVEYVQVHALERH